MRPGIFIVVAFFTGIISIINGQRPKKSSSQAAHSIDWYEIQLRVLQKESDQFLRAVNANKKEADIQKKFRDTRDAYKRLELFAGYFDPATAEALNGWNSFSFNDAEALRSGSIEMVRHVKQLKKKTDSLSVSDVQLFEAMEQEIEKMKNFEANENGAADMKEAMDGVKSVWLFYQDGLDHHLSDETRELFMEAHRMLDTAKVYNENTRAQFLVQYAGPLAANVLRTREALKIGERK